MSGRNNRGGIGRKSFLKSRPGLRKWLGIIQADPCVWCMGAGETAEHIVPISHFPNRRGSGHHGSSPHHWSNIARSCSHCNGKRDNTGLLLYLVESCARARTN